MQHLKIEKNVPLPQGSTVYRRYNWPSLEIGDSFVVNGRKDRASVRTAFIQFQKTHPDHFPPRTVLVSRDIGNDQFRFWLLQNP